MKKYYVVVFLLFMVTILPCKVSAECSSDELSRLQNIANNVTYTYEYIESTGNFNVTLTNLNKDIYFIDKLYKITYNYKNVSEITIPNYIEGDQIKYYIYSSACGSSLKIIYLTLPVKNKYYNYSYCEGIEEYYLCQKWVKTNISYDEFIEGTFEYKESLRENNNVEKEIEKNDISEIIISVYVNYYYYILPIIIILCVLGIIKLSKKRKLA